MASISSRMNRLMALIVVGLLASANMGVLVLNLLKNDSGQIWRGPLLPGKILPLPDVSSARIIPAPKMDTTPAKPAQPAQSKTKAPPANETTAQDLAAERIKKNQKKDPKKPAPKKNAARSIGDTPAPESEGYVVQMGSYVLRIGADSLVERIRNSGLKPLILTYREQVHLNNVQVGPFKTLEEAKAAEAQLKAGGILARTEEIWEGYILSLSKSILLSYSVEEMKKVQALGVEPVRLVKVEADLPVRKVILGPFPTKEKAKEMSARAAKLGLPTPIIKEYVPPNEPEPLIHGKEG